MSHPWAMTAWLSLIMRWEHNTYWMDPTQASLKVRKKFLHLMLVQNFLCIPLIIRFEFTAGSATWHTSSFEVDQKKQLACCLQRTPSTPAFPGKTCMDMHMLCPLIILKLHIQMLRALLQGRHAGISPAICRPQLPRGSHSCTLRSQQRVCAPLRTQFFHKSGSKAMPLHLSTLNFVILLYIMMML